MINRIPITIDERGSVNKDITILAMENENLSKTFSISLPNSVIDKWIYIEFEKADHNKFVSPRLTAVGGYVEYDLGIDLLDVVGKLICQVVAKDDSGVVWKSNKFDFTISGSINATEQVVESSPDVIADLQRQIDNISTGGDSGGDTSGEYVPVNTVNGNSNTTITNDGSMVFLNATDGDLYSQIEIYPSSINVDAPALTYKGAEVAIKDEIPIDGISIFMVADGATFTLDGEEIVITSEFLTPNDKEPKADDLVIFPNTGIASATDGKLYKIVKYRRSSATAYLATTGLTLIGGGNVDLTNYYTKNEVDTELSNLATIDELTTKQDTLTAGSNITIIDNVINAIGDGGTTDYNALENKPSINGVELSGMKFPWELGIRSILLTGIAFTEELRNSPITYYTGYWGFNGTARKGDLVISINPESYGQLGYVSDAYYTTVEMVEVTYIRSVPDYILNITEADIEKWNSGGSGSSTIPLLNGTLENPIILSDIAEGHYLLSGYFKCFSSQFQTWSVKNGFGVAGHCLIRVGSTNGELKTIYGYCAYFLDGFIVAETSGAVTTSMVKLDMDLQNKYVTPYEIKGLTEEDSFFHRNGIVTHTYDGAGYIEIYPHNYKVINCTGNRLEIGFIGDNSGEAYTPYQLEIGIDRVVPVLTIRNEEIELPMGFALEKYKRYQCEVINNKLSIKGIYNNYPYKWVFGLWTSADYTTSYNFKEDLTCTQTISGATTDGTFEVNESDTAITISVTLNDETFLLFTKNEDGTITSNGVVYTKLS